MGYNDTTETVCDAAWTLFLVDDVKILLPILKVRIPDSCNIYNMAMRHHQFSSEMHFYTLGKEVNEGSWIVATYTREDYGMDINISHPTSKENMNEMRQALITTPIISWEKPYIFAATHRDISSMIRDICVDEKGNNTCTNPCIMYYMNPEDCLQLKIKSHDADVEVRALEMKSGSQFLYKTWKFATEGSLSYIHKLLSRNESTGVFFQGTQVSGICVAGSGLMSMLYTNVEYRNKGYGKLCMQHHMKKMAENGLVPCCTVEYHNNVSNDFQKSVGLKFSHCADFITFSSNTF